MWKYEHTEEKPLEERQIIFSRTDYKKRGFTLNMDEVIQEPGIIPEKQNKDEERNQDIKDQFSDNKRPTGNFKGIDDGQYYRDQPITQPRRLSGAMFQPQNPKPREPDTNPSQLGSDYRNPAKDRADNKDRIHCPICGAPTLTYINALETMEDDVRCTQCGARSKTQDLMDSKLMEAMYNVVQDYNHSEVISIPEWKPKSFDKKLDINLSAKDYVGFDISKSFPQSALFADSPEYKKLIKEYLSDIPAKDRAILINILKNGLRNGSSIRDIAKQIEQLIEDKDRAVAIARTEIVRLSNEGNLMRMEDKETEKVEFISAPEDGRLCEDCARLDREIFTLKEARGMLPVHVSCRCLFTEYYEEP